jgi:hypothetical protein
METANQKNKIYFTAPISKYFNTPSIGSVCKFCSFDFFSKPCKKKKPVCEWGKPVLSVKSLF